MAQSVKLTKERCMLKRIAITGPESTGKSWLAAGLAAEFGEPWVPEFAREYLEKINRPYIFDDVIKIAQGQYQAEEKLALQAKEWLFCDTDFLVTRIWCLVKFGKSHPWIDYMVENHTYTHYLLCNTDLPWEADPLREHPHLRDELFKRYLAELEQRKLPFTIVSGIDRARTQKAMEILKGIAV